MFERNHLEDDFEDEIIDRIFGHNALVSRKPCTPIPGECGALAGHLSGFRPPLLPRYAGLSTTLDAIISDRG